MCRGKPVITANQGNTAHLSILGDKAFVFNNGSELISILSKTITQGFPPRDYHGYQQYKPMVIMKKFNDVFLKPVFDNQLTDFHLYRQCKI
jgi:hypothetical protein